MVFGKDSYDWLDDFKIYGNGNTASFNPTGNAYYFYLKRRGSDIKDIKDVFAEKIFDAPKQIETVTSAPIFSAPPVFERESPVIPNFDLKNAFGDGDSKIVIDAPF
jgi:hypothetical protein